MNTQLSKDQKAIITLLSLLIFMFLVRFAIQGALALTEEDFITYEDYQKYDFNLGTGSPTASGYTTCNGTTIYSVALGYGWNTTGADSRDRGAPTDLLRDFNWYGVGNDREFVSEVDEAGYYSLTFYLGDQSSSWGNMDIYVEGSLILSTLNSTSGVFLTRTVNVTVNDGYLNVLCAAQTGGTWRINGLDVDKGIMDPNGWLQYQIDLANETATENFETNVALIILFFTVAVSVAVGLLYARKKK